MSEPTTNHEAEIKRKKLNEFTAASLPTAVRKTQFKAAVESLHWCAEDDCRVEDAIEQTVLAAIKYALPAKAILGQKISVIGHIVARAAACKHFTFEEAQALVAQAAEKHQWEIEAGPDTACALRTLPEVYYNIQAKDYWKKIGQIYVPMGSENLTRYLVAAGFDATKASKGDNSEVDKAVMEIIDRHHVHGAGSFAGYKAGIFQHKGAEYLAKDSYTLIEPVPFKGEGYIDPKHIFAVLDGALTTVINGKLTNLPATRLMAWLKSAYIDLSKGRRSGGLCLVIVGEPDGCKTVILKFIITKLLGGRQANASLYLSKGSSFNDEMIGSEVWALDDGNPFAEYEARKAFSDMTKMSVAAEGILGHAKGKAALTIPLYRRLVVLCNPDALESAPEITGSMTDKVLLLKANKFAMPEGCLPIPERNASDAWEKFEAQFSLELPSFLGWLLQDPEVEKLCGQRFGTQAWQDPELVTAMWESTPLHTAAAIILKSCLGEHDADRKVKLRATDVFLRCASGPMKAEAAKVLKTSQAAGHFLTAMLRHPDYNGAVSAVKVKGNKWYKMHWTPQLMDVMCGDGRDVESLPRPGRNNFQAAKAALEPK